MAEISAIPIGGPQKVVNMPSNDRNLLLGNGHQESKNSRNSHRSARRPMPDAINRRFNCVARAIRCENGRLVWTAAGVEPMPDSRCVSPSLGKVKGPVS